MNNNEKILDLLTSMAQSIEQLHSGMDDMKLKMNVMDQKIDNMQDHFDARFDRLNTSIKNINSRELHMMDMILENRKMA